MYLCGRKANIETMNTIAIDTNIYKSVESFARNRNVSIREFIEKAILAALSRPLANADSNAAAQSAWREYKVSPEVMAMTFEERKDVSDDYAVGLQEILTEKYL